MSVQAHPRFRRRRSHVREHRARRNLRRALWVLLLVSSIWAVAWVAQSPLFSVTSIVVEGVQNARVDEVLGGQDVYPGRPLVLIRSGAVEEALAADPWVREASVHRRFPDRIEIQVTERVEVAAVPVAGAWQTISDDGHVMTTVAEAPARLARVAADVAFAGGEVSDAMLGVVEFLAALPDEVVGRTAISPFGTELAADIDQHRIRLGAPTNMAAKAAALAAVLADERLAPNAIIDLIAPARPAVSSPRMDDGDTT